MAVAQCGLFVRAGTPQREVSDDEMPVVRGHRCCFKVFFELGYSATLVVSLITLQSRWP